MFALLGQTICTEPYVRVIAVGDKWTLNSMARISAGDYIIRKVGIDNYTDCAGLDKADLAKWPMGLVVLAARNTEGLDCFNICNHTIGGLLTTVHIMTPVYRFIVTPVETIISAHKSYDTSNPIEYGWNKVLPELKEKIIKRILLPTIEHSSTLTFKEELEVVTSAFRNNDE